MAWHARLSASQTKDWFNCEGTIALKEAFPYDDPSGDAARLGTCAHALIERCLEEGVPPSSYIDRLIEIVHPDTNKETVKIHRPNAKWPKGATRVVYQVDDDMVEATTSFVEYVLRRLHELFPDTYTAVEMAFTEQWHAWSRHAVSSGVLKLEGRVNPLPERDDTGGTADVTIDAWPEMLEVVDYKNGVGVLVPVKGNLQLRTYLLGRAVELGETQEDSARLDLYEDYRYTIGQPRHHRAPPNGVSSEDLSAKDLVKFREELRAACKRVDAARALVEDMFQACAEEGSPQPSIDDVRQALYSHGHLSVGEDGSHCTYCPHINDCPAARKKAEETAGIDFENEPSEIEPPLGPNHLATVIPWVPFIKTFLNNAEKRAEELALEGQMPGYKMVRKPSNRVLKDGVNEGEVQSFLREHGGKADQMHNAPKPASLKTGPQLEKLLPRKHQKAFSDKFMYKPAGGLTMVPEDDGREAVTNDDPAADFEED